MKFKLNPLTGEFDYTSESANKQKLNPLTGEFNLVEGDGPFSQIFNPLNGKFNLGIRGGGGIIAEVTGNGYINLTNAVANRLMELKVYGGTEQDLTPTPDNPTDIVCNNGAIKFSKNLANITAENITEQKYIDNSGRTQDSPMNFIYSTYIPVKPNTDYTLSGNKNFRYASLMEYDVDKNFIKRTLRDSTTGLSKSWTTSSNTAYVLFGSNPGYNETMTLDVVQTYDFQFEEGDTPTPYHEYVEGGIYVDGTTETISSTLSTATAEMLLKVGDYQDEQEILSGNIIRRIGIKVLDGTEARGEKDQYGRVQLTVSDLPAGDITRKMAAYCTHFENLHNSEPIGNVVPGQFYVGNPKSFYFHILENNVAGFKTWLASQYNAGTPVIVVYPLATPTTESIAGQTMSIPKGNSTIEITQASLDNLGLYAKYLQSN